VDEVVANIQKEVKMLFKNAPVSEKNADKHLAAAWHLEQAAAAIRNRVARKKNAKAARMAENVKRG
jgi:hypothetical protein